MRIIILLYQTGPRGGGCMGGGWGVGVGCGGWWSGGWGGGVAVVEWGSQFKDDLSVYGLLL